MDLMVKLLKDDILRRLTHYIFHVFYTERAVTLPHENLSDWSSYHLVSMVANRCYGPTTWAGGFRYSLAGWQAGGRFYLMAVVLILIIEAGGGKPATLQRCDIKTSDRFSGLSWWTEVGSFLHDAEFSKLVPRLDFSFYSLCQYMNKIQPSLNSIFSSLSRADSCAMAKTLTVRFNLTGLMLYNHRAAYKPHRGEADTLTSA